MAGVGSPAGPFWGKLSSLGSVMKIWGAGCSFLGSQAFILRPVHGNPELPVPAAQGSFPSQPWLFPSAPFRREN